MAETGRIFVSYSRKDGAETARLEVDGYVFALAALPDGRPVAGDALGRLHWLRIVE